MHVLADIMRIQREETICSNSFFIEGYYFVALA